jgi:hypothetical protein
VTRTLSLSLSLSLLVALALGATGCRRAHLGDDTGRAYRDALAAQRDGAPAAAPTFDAGHARDALAARRGKASGGGAPAAGPSTITLPMPAAGGAGGAGGASGGAWPGATGNITLEAK